ncbi:protein BIG GRAIN 1-like A [Neltuma alba]|uniref:protein BIG GRAIN 1-like A n=1 Tax=Neltuma alba TaxID=207710 RepID=UPI0010A5102F|nr:protein BIG GRAIN 1-like A [Prosopis alba]
MYMLEKTLREPTFPNHPKNPSFSSSLLDKIYRSIEEGERESGDMKFHRDTMAKKHSRSSEKCNRTAEEEERAKANLRRACLIEKWMDKKVGEKVGTKRTHQPIHLDTKLHLEHDHDQDVLFFSSTSSSSDSSSGGFSSSDTESMYGVRSQSSCFAPPRPKPVKTSVSVRSDRAEKKDRGQKQREARAYDVHEEGLIKSKSRALKIYENIKKAKQPISPGGKLTNFLNALFTPGNTKKSKSSGTCSVGACEDVNAERKSKSGQASTCSSASSFSRSCLSKTSPSLRKDVKRTVRFYPVSVIVDEDSRPCGHKRLYKEEDTSLMPVSVPTAWKIGGSPGYKKNIDEDQLKVTVMEKSRRVEEAAREFLKEYHQNQRKSDLVLRDFPIRTNVVEEEEEDDDDDDEDDDDAASCASSDLFELDHLAVMGDARYSEELPVYETTHVSTNRAIASGLIM